VSTSRKSRDPQPISYFVPCPLVTLPLSVQPKFSRSTTRFQTLHASIPQSSVRPLLCFWMPRVTLTRLTLSPNRAQHAAISTDSEYSHHAWSQQPRAAGGLGPNLRIPLLADRNMNVAREYGCLIEDKGITFRASYLIDPKGVLRQITMNDLPVGRSVDEALRLVQAFQFTVSDLSCVCGGDGTDSVRHGYRMSTARYVLRIGQKVERRFGATPSRNSITLPRSMVNTRMARQMVPSVPASTRGWGGVWTNKHIDCHIH
jgi:AhpC/TSA family